MLTRALAFCLATLFATTATADAQNFGRNTIHYDRFHFSVLETEHFDIYYYDAEQDAVRLAAPMAERWYARLSKIFDHRFASRQPIILYASHGHFAQTSIVRGIQEGIGGFTDHAAGRVVLPFAAGLAETDHVLGHELVHAFQRDILKKRGRSLAMLPLWFTEGMAEHISLGRLDPHTQMWLRDAAGRHALPTLTQLGDPRWFPYRYGQAIWSYLEDRYGPSIHRQALHSRASGGGVGRLEATTGINRDALSSGWHTWIRETVTPLRTDTSASTLLVEANRGGGRFNIGPALSPDGRYLVFMSERDGFAMDVYLADADSGQVLRRLTSTVTDPHFDSLQYLNSSGAWSRDGTRLALTTVRDGQAALTVYAMPAGDLLMDVPIPDVDQAFSPDWSPDGARVAFSAMKGGLSDIYVFEPGLGTLTAMTRDPYSDLQPAWSPDGQQLVVVTDRFTSSLDSLSFGSYELALIDVGSQGMTRLASPAGAKNIDPHWVADGSIYFVSDADGTSDVRRLDVASGRITSVSAVSAGVSGVTSLSPAISLAPAAGLLAMSVYEDGALQIRMATLPNGTSTPEVGSAPTDAAGLLPLQTAGLTPRVVNGEGASKAAVNPEETDAFGGRVGGSRLPLGPVRPYVPRLSVLAVGQPYLSAGGGAFGGFLRAGTTFAASDVLGQHALRGAVQVGRRITDVLVQAGYANRRSRLNWGVVGGQVPALTGMTESLTPATQSGEAVLVRRTLVQHTIHRQLAATLSYPFNRGLRLETSVGIDRVALDRQTTVSTFAAGSRLLQAEEQTREAGRPATFFQSRAALVHDASMVGPLGPIVGERYRFSLSPSLGDRVAVTASADYRKYWMPTTALTVALRGQHVSRFGSGALDARLLPLVWTLRDLVRGFDVTDELLRTRRYESVNLEVRTPIPGAFHGRRRYGALPLEAFAFTDWGRFVTAPTRSGGAAARTLWSAGAGARFNAAGFVFEFAASRALTAAPGWKLAVNFGPAF